MKIAALVTGLLDEVFAPELAWVLIPQDLF
jgi:hypothetical protein